MRIQKRECICSRGQVSGRGWGVGTHAGAGLSGQGNNDSIYCVACTAHIVSLALHANSLKQKPLLALLY